MIGSTLAILGASLLGSVHCAAMCGSFACFYTTGAGGRDVTRGTVKSALQSHGMYNAGRLAAYAVLGALAGQVGAHVTHAAAWAGVARGATIVAGVMMILWGVGNLASKQGARVPALRVPLVWQRSIGGILNSVQNRSVAVRAGATGLLTGLIPCGWLYVFVTAAGATGSPWDGALVMAVFWLGTLPALIAVAIGVQRLLTPLRARLPQFSAVTVVIMGLLAVSGRMAFSHVH